MLGKQLYFNEIIHFLPDYMSVFAAPAVIHFGVNWWACLWNRWVPWWVHEI